MAVYVSNAFSLNMLERPAPQEPVWVRFLPISVDVAVAEVEGREVVSAVGHADTARLVGKMLGVELPVQRISVTIRPGDELIVAQYRGPRLPEGATELPQGASIEFWTVEVLPSGRMIV